MAHTFPSIFSRRFGLKIRFAVFGIAGGLAMCVPQLSAQSIKPTAPSTRPKLVVGIVVEGLNQDYINLLRHRFGDGGFNRLINQGVTISSLDFGTPLDGASATALLMTGASPSVNGIGSADVYDPEMRRMKSVMHDASTLGNFTDETLSPKALRTSTLADELRIDAGGLGYVYAIAPEAEAVMALAGHSGNSAFWVNDITGKWATSTFYKDLPSPVQSANHREPLEFRLDTLQWGPSVSLDILPDLPSFKKLYPFRYVFGRGDALRYVAYKNSPAVNRDITTLASDYISVMALGKRESMDMLNIGYTLRPFEFGHDADNRVEMMDAYLRLDKDIERLFASIDEKGPGMDHTLVFLAGTPMLNRTRRDDEKWNIPQGDFSSRKAVSLLNMYLMAIYGNGEWVSGYSNGQLYLNRKLIKERDKNLEELQRESARFLTRMSGVTDAWTINEVMECRAGEAPDALRRNTVVDQAGDVVVSIAPGWREIDDDDISASPRPATAVRAASAIAPAFILMPGQQSVALHDHYDARRFAPTIAGILRIRPPNGASQPPIKW